MPCNCGENKCSCSERCACPLKLCMCVSCLCIRGKVTNKSLEKKNDNLFSGTQRHSSLPDEIKYQVSPSHDADRKCKESSTQFLDFTEIKNSDEPDIEIIEIVESKIVDLIQPEIVLSEDDENDLEIVFEKSDRSINQEHRDEIKKEYTAGREVIPSLTDKESSLEREETSFSDPGRSLEKHESEISGDPRLLTGSNNLQPQKILRLTNAENLDLRLSDDSEIKSEKPQPNSLKPGIFGFDSLPHNSDAKTETESSFEQRETNFSQQRSLEKHESDISGDPRLLTRSNSLQPQKRLRLSNAENLDHPLSDKSEKSQSDSYVSGLFGFDSLTHKSDVKTATESSFEQRETIFYQQRSLEKHESDTSGDPRLLTGSNSLQPEKSLSLSNAENLDLPLSDKSEKSLSNSYVPGLFGFDSLTHKSDTKTATESSFERRETNFSQQRSLEKHESDTSGDPKLLTGSNSLQSQKSLRLSNAENLDLLLDKSEKSQSYSYVPGLFGFDSLTHRSDAKTATESSFERRETNFSHQRSAEKHESDISGDPRFLTGSNSLQPQKRLRLSNAENLDLPLSDNTGVESEISPSDSYLPEHFGFDGLTRKSDGETAVDTTEQNIEICTFNTDSGSCSNSSKNKNKQSEIESPVLPKINKDDHLIFFKKKEDGNKMPNYEKSVTQSSSGTPRDGMKKKGNKIKVITSENHRHQFPEWRDNYRGWRNNSPEWTNDCPEWGDDCPVWRNSYPAWRHNNPQWRNNNPEWMNNCPVWRNNYPVCRNIYPVWSTHHPRTFVDLRIVHAREWQTGQNRAHTLKSADRDFGVFRKKERYSWKKRYSWNKKDAGTESILNVDSASTLNVASTSTLNVASKTTLQTDLPSTLTVASKSTLNVASETTLKDGPSSTLIVASKSTVNVASKSTLKDALPSTLTVASKTTLKDDLPSTLTVASKSTLIVAAKLTLIDSSDSMLNVASKSKLNDASSTLTVSSKATLIGIGASKSTLNDASKLTLDDSSKSTLDDSSKATLNDAFSICVKKEICAEETQAEKEFIPITIKKEPDFIDVKQGNALIIKDDLPSTLTVASKLPLIDASNSTLNVAPKSTLNDASSTLTVSSKASLVGIDAPKSTLNDASKATSNDTFSVCVKEEICAEETQAEKKFTPITIKKEPDFIEQDNAFIKKEIKQEIL